jgi:hypothetical protein
MYHRGGCTMVEGRAATTLAIDAAEQRGLRPCPVCEPASAAASS